MRFKSLKIDKTYYDGILLAGTNGHKIYSIMALNGICVTASKNNYVYIKGTPEYKTLLDYCNLKYAKSSDIEFIKDAFNTLTLNLYKFKPVF